MTATQPDTLTPEQAREKFPKRFKAICREAMADAFALHHKHAVVEERYVVLRRGLFCPVAHLREGETVLATFGPHGEVKMEATT